MEPQKLCEYFPSKIPSLDNPKSVNLQWPLSSKTTLSGFKSRKIIPLLCKFSKANKTSQT